MDEHTTLPLRLHINGESHELLVEPRHTLLDVLRDDLQLTGAKKVCDEGTCGACTISIDGKSAYACLTLAADCDGREVTTIEGLAHNERLDPVQQAFIEEDAFQCGYCTPGQIMSMRALLDENDDPSEEEIVHAMSGNLCRCGAYQHILKAAKRAVELQKEAAR